MQLKNAALSLMVALSSSALMSMQSERPKIDENACAIYVGIKDVQIRTRFVLRTTYRINGYTVGLAHAKSLYYLMRKDKLGVSASLEKVNESAFEKATRDNLREIQYALEEDQAEFSFIDKERAIELVYKLRMDAIKGDPLQKIYEDHEDAQRKICMERKAAFDAWHRFMAERKKEKEGK